LLDPRSSRIKLGQRVSSALGRMEGAKGGFLTGYMGVWGRGQHCTTRGTVETRKPKGISNLAKVATTARPRSELEREEKIITNTNQTIGGDSRSNSRGTRGWGEFFQKRNSLKLGSRVPVMLFALPQVHRPIPIRPWVEIFPLTKTKSF